MKNSGISWHGSDQERKKLDVNGGLVLGISLLLTLAIYLLILPFKSSYVGILLYERGFTQPLAIWFATIVVAITGMKFIKVTSEFSFLKKFFFADTLDFEHPKSKDLLNLRKSLERDESLIALRCGRVIAAYTESESRKSAAEFALDDSAFYLTNSEFSYALPKILVWAVPLLGFIGTVVGISQAVNGFAGFLEKAGEIDQIKQGIGTVTQGLAVAFDTTLLALFISILVMIPLVLVERYESRLLLNIDIFINDNLLPRLKEKDVTSNLDEATIQQVIEQAVKNYFPTPESLIEPAHQYAQVAVNRLMDSFTQELSKLQGFGESLIEKLNQANQLSVEDRNTFIKALGEQQQASQNLINAVIDIATETKNTYHTLSQELNHQGGQISEQFAQTASDLGDKLTSLETVTAKLSEIGKLQTSLEQMVKSLDTVGELEESIQEFTHQLAKLQPSIEKLTKPRVVTFLDPEA